MGLSLGLGLAIPMGNKSRGWSTYWTHQSEVLFFGLYSEISGGKMPNKVTGATDYLTVAGVAGSETYQCPNTAAYIAADTDYIWFKTDTTQRTVTTAELIGYDLQRTPIKYNDNSPNEIVAIMILKAGEILSATKRNFLFRDMWLPILWDNNLNTYGHIKSNKTGQQLWTPEEIYEDELLTYISGLSTELSSDQKTRLNNLILAIKTGLSITNLSDAFDCLWILAGETKESSLRNIVKNAHHATEIGSPIWTQYEGFLGDATPSCLDANYNPSTQGIKFTIYNAHQSHYSRTDNDDMTRDIGATNGTYNSFHMRTSNNFSFYINADASSHSTISLDGSGLFITARNGTTEYPYINGVAGTTAAEDGRTLLNMNFYLAGFNNNGTPSGSSRQQAMASYGRLLNADEVLAFTNAIEAYMDANGKGVIS